MSGPVAPRYAVVVPTVGRPSLATLLVALARGAGPPAERIVVVDDRPADAAARPLALPPARPPDVVVLAGGGRGPAAARNRGWRACAAPWIAFLDDDVVPPPDWAARLAADLAAANGDVGGVEGAIRVPRPSHRPPTDWERNVAGLERARWATADLAYRRAALERVGGFDERFRRNYREDADLGLRVVAAGWRIVRGSRHVGHPVGPAGRWTSVRLQRGNADDALMRRRHGPRWRERAAAPPGRLRRHVPTAAAGAAAVALLAARRPRAAALAAGTWAAGTAELAWARIAPGPRTAAEVATMAATSAAIPFAATAHRLVGEWRWRHVRRADPTSPPPGTGARRGVPPGARRDRARRHPDARGVLADGAGAARPSQGRRAPADGREAAGPGRGRSASACGGPAAVLFDRDGTLIEDVPYNGDPHRVRPMPGARDAVATLRAAGVPTAVVSNQSGVARGLLTAADVEAVNARADALLGGVGPWLYCPHGPDGGCACRKPAPGLVLAAARLLDVPPARCVVIGDIGADVEAARAAGARGVLVPTARTRAAEIAAAPVVAPDLLGAVRHVLREGR